MDYISLDPRHLDPYYHRFILMNHILARIISSGKRLCIGGVGGEVLWVFGDRLDEKNGCHFVSKWIIL